MCPEFRRVLAAHGYTLDPTTGEVTQLAPYAESFSARVAQITRNIDRYEAQWRTDHPAEEPGPTLRRVWDRRAWAQARPDKVVPEEWDDRGPITFEEFCDIIRTPQRTVRDWRQRDIGPRWARFNGCGRLYINVAEARRFLSSANPTRHEERVDG